jgi:hypothetical protein
LFLAVIIAATLGFVAGWLARVWYRPSPETRARDAAQQIRDRVRDLTH